VCCYKIEEVLSRAEIEQNCEQAECSLRISGENKVILFLWKSKRTIDMSKQKF
jgi:hypothetical protein